MTSPPMFLPDVRLSSILDPAPPRPKTSATKVICTLGPACRSVDTLVELLEAGMSAARVDLTWGSPEYHVQSLKNVAEAMRRTKQLCATIVDTVGREVLVHSEANEDQEGWPTHKESLPIAAGGEVRLSHAPDVKSCTTCLPVNYAFEKLAQPGDTFFVGRYLASGAEDGSVWLEVKGVEGGDVVCTAQNTADLSGLLTVLHAAHEDRGGGLKYTDMPLLSEHDKSAVKYITEQVEIDFLALTFTRSGNDVREARGLLDELGLHHIKILAKVEDSAALYDFDDVAAAADGIIMSRGNLGLDVAPEKMARVQKSVISACNLLGKPVILTRIVDTMTLNPRPTRAEATDVANGVLDGVDAFMLGAETLRGRFPVATVSIVSAICLEAEKVFDHDTVFENLVAIARQADAEGEEQRKTLCMGSPDASHGTLPGEGCAADPSKQGGSPAMRHVLPSVASMGRLHRFGEHTASSRSLATLAAEAARRTRRLESVASTAVRAAAKIGARLIVVYAHSGRTASLVAKYRPSMPVLALMVPRLIRAGLRWELHGLSQARQILITRGVLPLLGAPMAGASDVLLQQAVHAAAARGIVGPHDHVVCILSQKEDLVVEVVSVDSLKSGCAAGGDPVIQRTGNPEPPFPVSHSAAAPAAGDSAPDGAANSFSNGGQLPDGPLGGGRPDGAALPYASPLHVPAAEAAADGVLNGGA